MASVVVKTVKGKRYRYLQRSYRVGGKVRTESKYLGPADGGKRRPKINWANTLMGGLALGAYILKHGTQVHWAKAPNVPPDPRSRAAQSAYDRQRWHEERTREIAVARANPPDDTRRAKLLDKVSHPSTEYAAKYGCQSTVPPSPEKNFTVDDEIEARQEHFERIVEEYNAVQNATNAAASTCAPNALAEPSEVAPTESSSEDGAKSLE
jgi:hypothetical protein